MQQAVSATFKSVDHDPLAEGDDIDLLGQFLKSWTVQDNEILRTKRLLSAALSLMSKEKIPRKFLVSMLNSWLMIWSRTTCWMSPLL